MAFMGWSDEMSVHIKLVDEQHMKLVDMLNKIWDALRQVNKTEVMASVLDELLDYTSYHFSTEEGLFRVHHYSDRFKHQKEHEKLTAQTLKFKERLTHSDLQAIEFLEFLKNWLNKSHNRLG
jgi:hemerythrin-like metal-binding protein